MPRLNLLPLPKSVREGKGHFLLTDDVQIILAPQSDSEVNAAWSFAGEAERKADVTLPVSRMGKLDGIGRRILFLVAGRDEKLYPKLKQLAKPISKAPKKVAGQAYVLKVTKNEIVAVARTPEGLYYAAQTLRQLLTRNGRVPCVTIADWPTYIHRGVMLDISRFKVPRLDSLFELIERLASLKINVFQIYTEHTFKLARHPRISEGCDPITAEDVIELDDFCKQHFVDLQANYQSFGHQGHMLSLPEYNAMAETPKKPWTMSPVVPRTYRFLDDAFSECLPAYGSKTFNASCDETWDLGDGKSRKLAAKVGVGRVYVDHIKKIHRLAAKYGKRMMIWGDIILQHPELIPDIPKDVILLDWGYAAGVDLGSMAKFKKAGLEFWTCPGVSVWQRIFAHFDNASRNITERAVAGEKHGAAGLLNTHWGDGGHPQMQSAGYRGYAWGAEQSWTPDPKTNRAGFDRRFARAWFGDSTGLFGKLYAEAEATAAVPTRRDENHCRLYWFYWTAFPITDDFGWMPPSKFDRVLGHARKALAIVPKLSELHPEHNETLVEILFGLKQLCFLAKKAEASREISSVRAEGKKLPASLKRTIRELRDEWDEHREEFEKLWLMKSRPSQMGYRLGEYKQRSLDYAKLLR